MRIWNSPLMKKAKATFSLPAVNYATSLSSDRPGLQYLQAPINTGLAPCRARNFSLLHRRCQILSNSSLSQSLRTSGRLHPKMASQSRQRSFNTAAVASNGVPSFAFAFDIDGVLLRSAAPIPGASEALAYLHNHKIPFILLTNGGGKHESVRVAELSKKLGVPLSEENFVQSHTPFKDLVHDKPDGSEGLKNKTILVTGGDGDKCRKVAESYGFKNVVTPGDILMACPKIWPFNQIFSNYYKSTARPLPQPINPSNPLESLKIDAMFVFNDPRDWALDTQIILDLLLSKDGVLGTTSEKNGDCSLTNHGWQIDGQPKLYFSNPDVFWATSYHQPRLGQGGFQACLRGVWKEVTKDQRFLKSKIIGKPSKHTYRYAEAVLNKYQAQTLGSEHKLKRVFMIGDNPESDIRGANGFRSEEGTEWTSVLVKTGVFQGGSKPAYEPKVILNDVLEAVNWALHQEGWNKNIE